VTLSTPVTDLDSRSATWLASPLGWLRLALDGEAVAALTLPAQHGERVAGEHERVIRARRDAGLDGAAAQRVTNQLEEYFRGERRTFDLALRPAGTPFQEAVWELLTALPHGATTTYGELARRLDRPGASRAVGAAVGRNPIAIVIPCHRVIGSNGALTGYAGGLAAKRWLMRHERASGELDLG
jgi:methylated-DNA-[protein]-cysteine S-methyltransferase